MNISYTSTILPLVLLATSAGGQSTASLNQGHIRLEGYVQTDRPEMFDGTLIGTVLGPAQPRRLLSAGGGMALFAVQQVRVADSRAFPKGTVVEAFLPYWLRTHDPRDFDRWVAEPLSQKDAMPVGARVLILGPKAEDGFLRSFDPDEPRDSPKFLLGASFGPAAYTFAFFETAQTGLPLEADPMWRMLGAVAESLRGTSDANAVKTADFLRTVRLPDWKTSSPLARSEDRLSLLFAKVAAKESAYHRALIDLELYHQHYLGYADRFYRDLYAAAKERDAFPDGLPGPPYYQSLPGTGSWSPEDVRHDPPVTVERCLAILKDSQSPTVAAWMLKDMLKPSDADVRDLGRFLDSPDPRLRWAFSTKLSQWYGGDAPPKPREVGGLDASRQEFPGLDAVVAAWKARLGALPKSP